MSSPPGLHCVLALCHCIACRPQTHVQGTFLYSQALQLPSNTALTARKSLQILPKVSDISRITYISQTAKCKEAHIWFKSVTFAYYCFFIACAPCRHCCTPWRTFFCHKGFGDAPERLLVFLYSPQWKHVLKDHKTLVSLLFLPYIAC